MLYLNYGFSVIPANEDKSPAIHSWKEFQQRRMVNGEVERNFVSASAVAIICGKVSGNMEVIDIDCKYDHNGTLTENFFSLLEDNLPAICDKLVIAKTKNKGWHIYYRCNSIEGNKKLATNAQGEVLIETRGEGGYVIAPPSPGYEFKKGTFENISTISVEEREQLLSIAQSFDESAIAKGAQDERSFGLSPFDDFNERGDVISLLEKHGWTVVEESGERIHLKRPGETKSKVSGNWHSKRRIFYPFTTSTQFVAGRGYNATMVFNLLECNGNYAEASKKLYEEGFGERDHLSKYQNPKGPTPEVLPFPVQAFPKFIRDFIKICYNVFQTPVDYWAGAVIAATALAVGNRLKLVTKYRNVPVFWTCLVGDVSSGKSEAQDICLSPFKKMDSESFEQYKNKLNEYERISNLTKKEKAEEGITENPKPQYFQYLLNDYTPESLADVHSINQRGIMIERDELKGWLDDFNRYSKSGEQSNMVSTWSGISIKFNRKTTDVLYIDNPTILVTGGMQPDLLPTLSSDYRSENGFLARMCFFYPENSQKPAYSDNKLSIEAQNEWDKFIRDLTKIPEVTELTLSPEAEVIYKDWYNINRSKTNDEGSGYLKGVYGKLDIISLRTAIVLKGMALIQEKDYSHEISGELMESAILITEYFRSTALKVYYRLFSQIKDRLSEKNVALFLVERGISVSETGKILGKHRQQIQKWKKE